MAFRFSALFALSILALLSLSGCGDTNNYNGAGLPQGYKKFEREPNPIIEMTTSAGVIKLELFEDRTPDTVDNFVELVEKKFYDGLTFHRIIKDFMIQGGDPMGNGMGGPGYKFDDEINPSTNKIDQYTLAMANSGKDQQTGKGTNGSQFFIVTNQKGAHYLDDRHTAFGKVIDGKDVVDKLNLTPVTGEKPTTPMTIVSAKVVTKRNRTYKLDEKKKTPDRSMSFPHGTDQDKINKMLEGMNRRDPNAKPPEFDTKPKINLTPTTKPADTNAKPTDPNAKPIDPNAKSVDSNAKPADPAKTPPPAAPKSADTPK